MGSVDRNTLSPVVVMAILTTLVTPLALRSSLARAAARYQASSE